jgi:hypothetical protein
VYGQTVLAEKRHYHFEEVPKLISGELKRMEPNAKSMMVTLAFFTKNFLERGVARIVSLPLEAFGLLKRIFTNK